MVGMGPRAEDDRAARDVPRTGFRRGARRSFGSHGTTALLRPGLRARRLHAVAARAPALPAVRPVAARGVRPAAADGRAVRFGVPRAREERGADRAARAERRAR